MNTDNGNIGGKFSFTLLDGSLFDLSVDDAQVILVVNTASQCGFAKQFSALQNLHDRYHARGFTVLAVSSQSFGKQELEDVCEIESAMRI